MSFFKKDKKEGKHVTKWIKKVDTIITWLVLWWILASVYWIKKYEDSKKSESWELIIENPKNKKEILKKEKKDSVVKIVLKIILKKIKWRKK